MKIRQYQVDAFARRVFEGNPAAVCPLEGWLDDGMLLAIATENNLSETAFFVPSGEGFRLRWFTPVAEVDLCGHATLASAHVLFEHLGFAGQAIEFETRSGKLIVRRNGELLTMDFPASVPEPCDAPRALIEGLGIKPVEVLAAGDYIAVLESEAEVRAVVPDPTKLCELDLRGVCVTARGSEADFVSRFFGPRVGVLEDPVTGSAHCELAPYWGAKLGKSQLRALQVSKRGGEILCTLQNDRVILEGCAVTFMEGEIRL